MPKAPLAEGRRSPWPRAALAEGQTTCHSLAKGPPWPKATLPCLLVVFWPKAHLGRRPHCLLPVGILAAGPPWPKARLGRRPPLAEGPPWPKATLPASQWSLGGRPGLAEGPVVSLPKGSSVTIANAYPLSGLSVGAYLLAKLLNDSS